ncbi:hypothetical protein PSHT_04459 [Puccinia striiformis]|uniref:Transmembrane protein n=1 Tax=Puccinia striiformis TaxID=27350 RepID=A0A2S4WCX9_9BASI|nr:hypothetical protein PSHT_04459 [Puccinia striiformis]
MEQIIDTEARIIVPLAIGWGLPNAIAAVSALFTLCFKSYNKVCKKRRVCSNTSIAFISGLLCFCQKVFPTFKRERNKSRALEGRSTYLNIYLMKIRERLPVLMAFLDASFLRARPVSLFHLRLGSSATSMPELHPKFFHHRFKIRTPGFLGEEA